MGLKCFDFLCTLFMQVFAMYLFMHAIYFGYNFRFTEVAEAGVHQFFADHTLNSLINEQTRINEYGGKIFSFIA